MSSYKYKKSYFQKIICGVLQGLITGPILFNFSVKDLFFFVSSASIHNLVDDYSLSAIAKTVAELKSTLQSESDVFQSLKKIKNLQKKSIVISVQ